MRAPRLLTRLAARFLRRQDGAATVEFAIIFPVVFGLVTAFFEAGVLMTRSMMLERGLDLAVRELRIGTAANLTHAELKALVCDRALVLPDCVAHMAIELIPVVSSADLPDRNAVCVDRTTNIDPTVRYDPGARSEVVFVRACMVVDPFIPGMGLALNLPLDPSGGFTLIAYSAFVNEPE
jgi:hypothetical protein